jgi:hypothetical protein
MPSLPTLSYCFPLAILSDLVLCTDMASANPVLMLMNAVAAGSYRVRLIVTSLIAYPAICAVILTGCVECVPSPPGIVPIGPVECEVDDRDDGAGRVVEARVVAKVLIFHASRCPTLVMRGPLQPGINRAPAFFGSSAGRGGTEISAAQL